MRFHVLGLGPLGSLVAHHLRRAIPPAHSVSLLFGKPATLRHAPTSLHVETDGAITSSSGFNLETFEPSEYTDPQAETNIESLFVTTRAASTLPALRLLAPRLSSDSTIVLIQNGLGVYEQLIQNVFRDPHQRPHFIFASATHAALFPAAHTFYAGAHTVLHPVVGHVEFAVVPDPFGRNFEAGFLDEAVNPAERRPRLSDLARPEGDPLFQHYRSLRNTVAALLLAEPLNARWKGMAHVQLALRRKLVVHSVIHPLTAIMGCRYGDVFSSPNALRIATRICEEASDVYTAQIREETKAWMDATNPEMGGVLGIARLPHALEAQSLVRECVRVSQTAQGAISPMLSALRNGRRTEIDYLNGYLLRLGKTYDVQMTANATVYNLLRMRAAVPIDLIL
ncbi:ketopantoate reductase PanE/ApbA C terminal-domain-containing protein [Mycena rosella]|uniref:Ketopantoate reductase PanE/ApbA C terminal-domain-containing protein n=1 Tax=Mycena rosella TaxID=1033263 RepID=A0AAD7M8Y6_MYCRO|nr:ketopantoate reductase PanE/ApbA C terminal-domain-containing protein [Mycena rosella]